MDIATHGQYNFLEQLKRVPVLNKVVEGSGPVAKGVTSVTSFAGVDWFLDAKVRGWIQKYANFDINQPLLKTPGDTISKIPGVSNLKVKDVGYGAIGVLSIAKSKGRGRLTSPGTFLLGSVLLKRWLESRGATTGGNYRQNPRDREKFFVVEMS